MTTAPYQTALDWITTQHEEMVALLESWAEINTGTDNIAGLSKMADVLLKEFACLNPTTQTRIALKPRRTINSKGDWIETPLGDALLWQKNPEAKVRVFLGGHMDTVFSEHSPFQKTSRIDKNIMCGPGVADMKGGLLVLLKSLQAIEQSHFANILGWDVLINPDEEIGSPGSEYLFKECATRNQIGLIFEPAYPDGSFVSSRKGSSNWTAIARGRSAHVGRNIEDGRNAITALAKFLLEVEKLAHIEKGIAINIGHIEGGGPVNIVPDLAIGRFNVRVIEAKDLENLVHAFYRLSESLSQSNGVSLTLHEITKNPPKPFDANIQVLFEALKKCAKQLGFAMHWKPSGGACDGCRLYADGLPNIDTLGVVGDHIHTHNECIFLDSLTERTKLTTLFLMSLAAGEESLWMSP